MSNHQEFEVEQYAPQILAVLIDRAGGTLTLSEQDVQRIKELRPKFQHNIVDDFSEDGVRLRYSEDVTIAGELESGA